MNFVSADCATDRREDFAAPYPVVVRTESGVYTPTPSEQTYIPLLEAFNFFNRELFNATLPDVLMTLQRKARTLGYFSRDRFAELKGDARAHEDPMNPAHFRQRSPKDTCSTLVHEMVHLQQECFGKPTRAGYHNREWARMMRRSVRVELPTGAPGGEETGYRMDHYIVEGGPFDLSYARFETIGQTVGWGDAGARRLLTEAEARAKAWLRVLSRNASNSSAQDVAKRLRLAENRSSLRSVRSPSDRDATPPPLGGDIPMNSTSLPAWVERKLETSPHYTDRRGLAPALLQHLRKPVFTPDDRRPSLSLENHQRSRRHRNQARGRRRVCAVRRRSRVPHQPEDSLTWRNLRADASVEDAPVSRKDQVRSIARKIRASKRKKSSS